MSTPINLMDTMRDRIIKLLEGQNYITEQPSGKLPIEVYSGYPPIRDSAKERHSFIYVLAADINDEKEASSATLEIGFSIYDDDKVDGWRSLYNVVEHIRQDLLKFRFLGRKHRLILPLNFKLDDREQPYPQYQGIMTVKYSIGHPNEEGFNYDDFQGVEAYGKYEKWKEK